MYPVYEIDPKRSLNEIISEYVEKFLVINEIPYFDNSKQFNEIDFEIYEQLTTELNKISGDIMSNYLDRYLKLTGGFKDDIL